MTLKQFKNHLEQLIGAVLFDYKGYSCGVDPISRKHYDVWCGNEIATVQSIDELMSDKFFDGLSLIEILHLVDVSF